MVRTEIVVFGKLNTKKDTSELGFSIDRDFGLERTIRLYSYPSKSTDSDISLSVEALVEAVSLLREGERAVVVVEESIAKYLNNQVDLTNLEFKPIEKVKFTDYMRF